VSELVYTLPFIMMFLLGMSAALVVTLISRSVGGGSAIIATTFILNAMVPRWGGLQLGIPLYFPDVTLGLIAVATLLRFAFIVDARPKLLPFYVLLFVFSVNLVQGLVVFGTAAGVSARPTFYGLVACSYVMTFPLNEQRVRALFGAFAWTGLILFMLACYRSVAVALDLRELLPPSGSFQPAGHSVWRVIISSESLVVAQTILSLWAFAGLAPGVFSSLRLLAPLLLVVTVVLQHRSVWLATTAGYVALRLGRATTMLDTKQLVPVLALASFLGLGAGFVASGSGSGSGSGIGADVIRLGGWKSLMQQWADSGPRAWVLGKPYGSGVGYYTSDDLGAQKVTWQAHNYYVELLTSLGVLGLSSYLSLAGLAVRDLWRTRAHLEHGLAARWLLVMLAFQMTYYLTYGVDYMQALLLGAALSLVGERRSAASSVAGRVPSNRPPPVRRTP
jgi:hypothetical protein